MDDKYRKQVPAFSSEMRVSFSTLALAAAAAAVDAVLMEAATFLSLLFFFGGVGGGGGGWGRNFYRQKVCVHTSTGYDNHILCRPPNYYEDYK